MIEIKRIITDAILKSILPGWITLEILSFAVSKPRTKINIPTNKDAIVSVLSWPNGWSLSAGLFARWKDKIEIIFEPASVKVI